MQATVITSAVDEILAQLSDLGAHIDNQSVTTASVYIGFSDQKLGKLRVGDHPGKQKYRFKWNVRTDLVGITEQYDNGVLRIFCSATELPALFALIREKADVLTAMENSNRLFTKRRL